MRPLLLSLVLLLGMPLGHAQDARIAAQLSDTAEPVIPLKQVLGEKKLNEAMASGRYIFVTNAKCRLCHRDFFVGRKRDMHDHTFNKLLQSGHGDEPQCVGCHSTGFGVKRGFQSTELTPQLANVQCEGCHGPGSEHIRLNAKGGLLVGTDQPELLKRMCLACHNTRWNRAFDNVDQAYDGYKTAKPANAQ